MTALARTPLYVLLRQYRVLPIAIIGFFGWLTLDITRWYQAHYAELHEWQVVPILGYLGSLVASLKFALEHVLAPCPGEGDFHLTAPQDRSIT